MNDNHSSSSENEKFDTDNDVDFDSDLKTPTSIILNHSEHDFDNNQMNNSTVNNDEEEDDVVENNKIEEGEIQTGIKLNNIQKSIDNDTDNNESDEDTETDDDDDDDEMDNVIVKIDQNKIQNSTFDYIVNYPNEEDKKQIDAEIDELIKKSIFQPIQFISVIVEKKIILIDVNTKISKKLANVIWGPEKNYEPYIENFDYINELLKNTTRNDTIGFFGTYYNKKTSMDLSSVSYQQQQQQTKQQNDTIFYSDFCLVIVKEKKIVDVAIHGVFSSINALVDKYKPRKIYYKATLYDPMYTFMNYKYQPFYESFKDIIVPVNVDVTNTMFNPISFCIRRFNFCAFCRALKIMYEFLIFKKTSFDHLANNNTTTDNKHSNVIVINRKKNDNAVVIDNYNNNNTNNKVDDDDADYNSSKIYDDTKNDNYNDDDYGDCRISNFHRFDNSKKFGRRYTNKYKMNNFRYYNRQNSDSEDETSFKHKKGRFLSESSLLSTNSTNNNDNYRQFKYKDNNNKNHSYRNIYENRSNYHHHQQQRYNNNIRSQTNNNFKNFYFKNTLPPNNHHRRVGPHHYHQQHKQVSSFRTRSSFNNNNNHNSDDNLNENNTFLRNNNNKYQSWYNDKSFKDKTKRITTKPYYRPSKDVIDNFHQNYNKFKRSDDTTNYYSNQEKYNEQSQRRPTSIELYKKHKIQLKKPEKRCERFFITAVKNKTSESSSSSLPFKETTTTKILPIKGNDPTTEQQQRINSVVVVASSTTSSTNYVEMKPNPSVYLHERITY